jgi:hypothetical protein
MVLARYLAAGASPRRALAAAFLDVDAALAAGPINVEYTGSTCVMSYLRVGAWVVSFLAGLATPVSSTLTAPARLPTHAQPNPSQPPAARPPRHVHRRATS